MSRAPIASFKSAVSYGVQIAAWDNDNDRMRFTISKRYKDKDTGEYKNTTSFGIQDLAALLVVAQRAIEFGDRWKGKPKESVEPEPFIGGETLVAAPLPSVKFGDDDIPF